MTHAEAYAKELIQGRKYTVWYAYLTALVVFGTAEEWRALFVKENGYHRYLYQAYLSSTAWRRKRYACLEDADGKCNRCQGSAVQAHHKMYERIGDELPADLEALCLNCHEQEHSR